MSDVAAIVAVCRESKAASSHSRRKVRPCCIMTPGGVIGAQVIEAHYLFGASYDNIQIVIHPQSIIHSMVETQDSSVLAQLGWPDMRLPILYTMSWPQRVPCSETTWPRLDFTKMGELTFRDPDNAKYPAMDLAYAAGRTGGTMTGVLSAANEQANTPPPPPFPVVPGYLNHALKCALNAKRATPVNSALGSCCGREHKSS